MRTRFTPWRAEVTKRSNEVRRMLTWLAVPPGEGFDHLKWCQHSAYGFWGDVLVKHTRNLARTALDLAALEAEAQSRAT